MNIEIANRLVTLRKKQGFSQEELAQKLGITRQAISKWERAESSPDTDNLIALSKLYNITLDTLLEADNESIENEKYAKQFDTNKKETDSDLLNDFIKATKPKTKWFYFPYPLCVAFLYLILGWTTGRWEIFWFVFLTIPVYYLIGVYLNMKK